MQADRAPEHEGDPPGAIRADPGDPGDPGDPAEGEFWQWPDLGGSFADGATAGVLDLGLGGPGDPYRPWFVDGEPGSPWFIE